MGIVLYTAPDCLRCKIVKAFLHEKNVSYESVDFAEQKTAFNAFYRSNRPKIYRNPEGVEFPLFDDGDRIKQGSGEIIAYLLAGAELEGSVTRSDLLHGWISGLYPSLCPGAHEEHYRELVRRLADGGLRVHVQTDGRKPELLEKLVQDGHISRLTLNVLGPASIYEGFFGGPISADALARTLALVNAFPGGEVRLLVSPVPRPEGPSWLSKEEAAEAAGFVAEAGGNSGMPFGIAAVTKLMPQGLLGLEAFDAFLPYRSAVRKYLFRAEIAKE